MEWAVRSGRTGRSSGGAPGPAARPFTRALSRGAGRRSVRLICPFVSAENLSAGKRRRHSVFGSRPTLGGTARRPRTVTRAAVCPPYPVSRFGPVPTRRSDGTRSPPTVHSQRALPSVPTRIFRDISAPRGEGGSNVPCGSRAGSFSTPRNKYKRDGSLSPPARFSFLPGGRLTVGRGGRILRESTGSCGTGTAFLSERKSRRNGNFSFGLLRNFHLNQI